MGLRAEKKAATRAALVQAAIAQFLARGYDAVSIEEICAPVGVSGRTFFRYFDAKDDVVFHDVSVYRDAFTQVIALRPAGEPGLATARRGALAVAAAAEARIADLRPRLALIPANPVLIARWAELDAFWFTGIHGLLVGEPDADLTAGALVGGLNAALAGYALDPTREGLAPRVGRLFARLASDR
jgi:AcrR family transcriptional regulator